MIKLIVSLSILFYTTTLFGAYDVKLGVYKNVKNVHANIAKIKNTKYRKSIIIDKKRNKYYVHAIIESNKEARNALRAYRRIFKDAFISKRQVRVKKAVKKAAPPVAKTAAVKESIEQNNTIQTAQIKEPIEQNQTVTKVEIPKPIEKINAQALLTNKTIYLCYEEGPAHLKGRVVEMVFEKDHVIYNPLKKMTRPVKMPYTFKDNNLTLELSGMKIIHDLYKKEGKCLCAKSVIDGLEVNKLRYYFDKEAAMAFAVGK